ncbi:MAG: 5-oxoprolinase subunit PxpA [Chromatiales bacterium]|nr:5-oxoprolinase subunit PxpA [Chromatiales bacterium]
MALKLNCDLGESFGAWTMGMDEAVMPHIDLANIACGFHAGDPVVMQNTLALAKQHGVTVGAHPGYRDLNGFGRRSIQHQPEEIIALMLYQISALEGMAKAQGIEVEYVKPHGALYNDMMSDHSTRRAVLQAMAEHHSPPILVMQATPEAEQHLAEAEALGIQLWFEAFSDRGYSDDGRLVPRTQPGALLDRQQMLAQAQQLTQEGAVTTSGGKRLELKVDTLCVHGDNPEGIEAIRELRRIVQG